MMADVGMARPQTRHEDRHDGQHGRRYGRQHDYRFVLGLGSNLGDRLGFLKQAVSCLVEQTDCRVLKHSRIYETPPLGDNADQPFLNSAVLVASSLTPMNLLAEVQEIEAKLGRQRVVHWGNRTIDIDLLLAAQLDYDPQHSTPKLRPVEVDRPKLSIPHPELLGRDFALVPCADVVADWLYPASTYTIAEHCQRQGFHLRPCKQDHRSSTHSLRRLKTRDTPAYIGLDNLPPPP